MSYRFRDIDDAMVELRALSGIGDSISRRHDLTSLYEEEDKAKSIAGKEDLKGRLETLQERLKGVVEFIEDENVQAATYTMKKIVEDAQDILETMSKEGKGAGKETKQRGKSMDQGDDKEKKVSKADDVTHPSQKEVAKTQQAPQPGPGASASKAESVDRRIRGFLNGSGKREYIEGEVIENVDGRDPFGLGPQFLAEMRREMGL